MADGCRLYLVTPPRLDLARFPDVLARALDAGDVARYDAAIRPTLPLSRTIFEDPTFNYKAGIAFLAWINGLQPHFAMLDRFQGRRTAAHLIRVFELAASAGALLNPELAVDRMDRFLAEGTGSTGSMGSSKR